MQRVESNNLLTNDDLPTLGRPIIAIFIAILALYLIQDTPQSLGLPPIEEYKNDYPESYDETFEKELSAKEIFFEYVFKIAGYGISQSPMLLSILYAMVSSTGRPLTSRR